MRVYLLPVIYLIFACKAFSLDSLENAINKRRLLIPAVTGSIAYTGSLIYLSEAWYTDSRTSFHFFDDLPQWKQMDKAGHLWTSFHESRIAAEWLNWSGVEESKSYMAGSITGFLLQIPLELLDGYAPEYGASISDIAANGLGSTLLFTQYLIWNKIKIQPKFSFHKTRYARINPDALGSNLPEQILKDYNGQTYWLSGNVSQLLNLSGKFPAWLNIAAGYSAEEMIRGRNVQNVAEGYRPYRQYYLSMDIDFSHVKTKQKWLKVLLYPLNLVHIPFPALEVSRKGLKLHPIYF